MAAVKLWACLIGRSREADLTSHVYVCCSPAKTTAAAGGSGFITKDMIKQHFAAPGPNTMVLSCGPKPMTDAMKGYLDSMGYSEEAQFQF